MTKKQIILYVLAVVVISVIAYFYTSVVEAPKVQDRVDSKDIAETNNLAGTSWRWLSTTQLDGSEFKPSETESFIIAFDDKLKFSSKTDCNAIGGSYLMNGSRLSFDNFYGSKMYCPDSDETIYREHLRQAGSYKIDSAVLQLYSLDSILVMNFALVQN